MQGFVEFGNRVEDAVTDFLKETSLDHSDMRFPRALVFGLIRPGRQHRKAHVIGKVTVSGIDIGIVEIGLVHPALEIIYHHVGSHPAKVGEHPLLDSDESGKLLIHTNSSKVYELNGKTPRKNCVRVWFPVSRSVIHKPSQKSI